MISCLDIYIKYKPLYKCFLFISPASDPVCSSDHDLGDLTAGDNIKLSCDVSYSVRGSDQQVALWAPRMSWQGPGAFEVTDQSIPGWNSRFTTTLAVSSGDHGRQFICTTYFGEPTPQEGLASNAPHYTHIWHSDVLIVDGGE